MRPLEVRKDISEQEMREAAKKAGSAAMCRRILGLAHMVGGGIREEAQKIACLTTSNFSIWIKRFNAEGMSCFEPRTSPGRPPKLTSEVEKELRDKVVQGPSEEAGIVRYRLVDLQAFLKEQHNIDVGISGLWRILNGLGLTWKTGRQRHPKSDEEAQEAFKKTLKISSQNSKSSIPIKS